MAGDEIKDDRRYTKEHEWAKQDGGEVLVGVTAYAVGQLGDITMVNLDVGEGDEVELNAPFGTVESVKAVSDLFAPISGKIVRLNEQLEDQPELINDDCYEHGWFVAVAPAKPDEYEALMDPGAYAEFVKDLD